MTDRPPIVIAIICALILTAPSALAHRINVFAEVCGGKIEGECYSSNGKPIPNATIRFVSPEGMELGTAQSDADGAFSFTPTERIDHHVILDTGDGHRATFVIKAGGLPAASSTATPPQPQSAVPPARRPRAHERQWRWRDVFSGIGYIFGLAGIMLYFQARRRKN